MGWDGMGWDGMQDNDPKHCSRLASSVFEQADITDGELHLKVQI